MRSRLIAMAMVMALMVFGNSDVRWVTAFGAHVAYHFERHRLTD